MSIRWREHPKGSGKGSWYCQIENRALYGNKRGPARGEIALATMISENVVSQRLLGMMEKGEVIKTARGKYALPGYAPWTPRKDR
jgi:hypothetical protein